MEVTTISSSSIKIKGKQAAFAVNPVAAKAKIGVSSAIFFDRVTTPVDLKIFEEEPLIIQGPGDYEVGGIKFSGNVMNDSFVYRVTVDMIGVLCAKTSSLIKSKDSAADYDILLLEADAVADPALITPLNPSVIIFYGEKKDESAKAMGREEGSAVSKYSVTREKLPTEIQIVTLQ